MNEVVHLRQIIQVKKQRANSTQRLILSMLMVLSKSEIKQQLLSFQSTPKIRLQQLAYGKSQVKNGLIISR